jgi:N-acetylglutamate synthase-like GNAT family acetyltransferase
MCCPGPAPDAAYVIRKSTIGDLAKVTDLLQASYPTLMRPAYDPGILDPALELIARANSSLLSSGTYYVAEAGNGAIVGCGGWSRERPGGDVETEAVAHIRHFGTHPGWARRGIGTAIFRRCEADARETGIQQFECYSSLNAERFYSSLGFVRISLLDIRLTREVTLPACHMRFRCRR